MWSSAGLTFALTGVGVILGTVGVMLTLRPEDMVVGSMLLGLGVLLIVIGLGMMLAGRWKRESEKISGLVVQTSAGPNSPNIAGDHNQLTINPDVNPNAVVVTYNFDGTRRWVSYAPTHAVGIDPETPQKDAFRVMVKAQDDEDWKLLRDTSEQEIKKTPEWLTPHLFAAVADAQLGEIDKAIQFLDYVRERSGGRLDYAQADRLRDEIRKIYGK